MGAIKVLSAAPHPTERNKIRVTFSEAFVLAGAETPGNYSFSPSITPAYAKAVSGSGNTQVDLHFGVLPATDANTKARYVMEEGSGSALDSSGNGLDLAVGAGISVDENGLHGRSRRSNAAATAVLSRLDAGGTDFRTTLVGSWTLNVLAKADAVGANGYIVSYNGGTGETQAENWLLLFLGNADGSVSVFWEFGAGADQLFTSPANMYSAGEMVLWTIRKRLQAPATTYAIDLFKNGRLVRSQGGYTNADGGTSANNRFGIFRDPNNTFGGWAGQMDFVRLQNIAQSDAVIAAEAKAVLDTPVWGTQYDLTVANVQDSATSTPIVAPNDTSVVSYMGQNDVVPSVKALDGFKQGASRLLLGSLTEPLVFLDGLKLGSSRKLLGDGVKLPDPPAVPPVITNFTPAVGSTLTPNTAVSFDVTDDFGQYARIIIVADFPNLKIREVIHDGFAFGPLYAGSSNGRAVITKGFRYTVLRDGGWPSSPTIIPYAIDSAGAENV